MSDAWIALLTGGGIFTVVTTIITGVINYRRSGAETDKLIEETTSLQISNLAKENQRLWDELKRFQSDMDTLRRELRSRDSQVDEMSRELFEVRLTLADRDRRLAAMSVELDDFIAYTRQLQQALLERDPGLELPRPPARIAGYLDMGPGT